MTFLSSYMNENIILNLSLIDCLARYRIPGQKKIPSSFLKYFSTSWDCILILKILNQQNNISVYHSSNLLLDFKNQRKVEGQITFYQVYIDYNRNGSINLPSSNFLPCLMTFSVSATLLSIGSSSVFSKQSSKLLPT